MHFGWDYKYLNVLVMDYKTLNVTFYRRRSFGKMEIESFKYNKNITKDSEKVWK